MIGSKKRRCRESEHGNHHGFRLHVSSWGSALPETNSKLTPENRPFAPKGFMNLPTTIFQRLLLLVSGKPSWAFCPGPTAFCDWILMINREPIPSRTLNECHPRNDQFKRMFTSSNHHFCRGYRLVFRGVL